MKNINLIIITLLILSFGCNESKKGSQISDLPLVNIQNKQYYTPYCLYFLNETHEVTASKIEKIASEVLPSYQLVDSLSDKKGENEYVIEWITDPKNEYPAPSLDYLAHSGYDLSNQEMNQLQSPLSAVLLVFSGTNQSVISDQISINLLISSLLQNNSAIVTDYTTYESFNEKSWNEIRVSSFNLKNQDIVSQFAIHYYREGGFCRAVTLGLGKFCLPDISIQDISCNDQRSYGSLINLISQIWLEKPKIREDSTIIVDIATLQNDSLRTTFLNSLEDGAQKNALVSLAAAEPQEGDAYNVQFEIIFKDKSYSSKQEEQEALITQVFGSTDEIDYIKHDEKILEASRRAKERLPELKKMFNQGLAPGYSILLKGPFETDNDGREWMWVEVTKWEDASIKGILQNEPFEISNLSVGAIVTLNSNDIFDYILYLPDGSTEGNETGKIIGAEN